MEVDHGLILEDYHPLEKAPCFHPMEVDPKDLLAIGILAIGYWRLVYRPQLEDHHPLETRKVHFP